MNLLTLDDSIAGTSFEPLTVASMGEGLITLLNSVFITQLN